MTARQNKEHFKTFSFWFTSFYIHKLSILQTKIICNVVKEGVVSPISPPFTSGTVKCGLLTYRPASKSTVIVRAKISTFMHLVLGPLWIS